MLSPIPRLLFHLPVHQGGAHLLLGGRIENPVNKAGSGEVRGTGMEGERGNDLKPCDQALVPRSKAK